MRQVTLFIAALFCLALAVQHFALADEVKETKDKGKEWAEASVWDGVGKTRWPKGGITTGDIHCEVTKRDGKSFEARYVLGDNGIVMKFEGEVDATGKINFTITKIAKAPNEWMAGPGRNMVGVKGSGAVDGKTVSLKAVQPDPDHPKTAEFIHTWKLKLKGDD
jgi:hypothetical protein